jgi:hypothetical protein
MTYRPSVRIAKALRVKVRGVDRNGQPFVQTALTKDISPKGACIEGLTCVHSAGQIIEVQRWWKRARFRVVWVGDPGTPRMHEAGVFCLEPDKNIWGVRFPLRGSDTPVVSDSAIETSAPARDDAAKAGPPAPTPITPAPSAFDQPGIDAISYQVYLRCPYGDEEGWVTARGHGETLEQILTTTHDYECSLHGVQSTLPLEARAVKQQQRN